jgi:WD40 repeat protein
MLSREKSRPNFARQKCSHFSAHGKGLTMLAAGLCGLLPAMAQAVTVSTAEVRGDIVYVAGDNAGRKQAILWEGVQVTSSNPKGRFSFEGDLPAGCVPGDCNGTLTAGGDTITVTVDYEDNEPPGEPPGEELQLIYQQPAAHDGDDVRAVGFALAGATERIVSGGEDAQLRYWTPELSQEVARQVPNIIYDVDVSADRSLVVSGEGGWNGSAGADTLRLWDASGTPLAQTQAPIGYVYTATISPDNNWIAASGFYGEIVVYRTDGLELYATKATKKKRTKALAFSPDGSVLASSSTASRVQLWSFPADCAPGNCELELLLTISQSGSWTFPLAFAPYSTAASTDIVTASDGGTIKISTIENLAANPTVSVRSVETGAVYAVAWSPNGSMIATGKNGDITVYDSTDLSILFENTDAHGSRVNDVAFSADSSRIVSGGADGELKVWQVPAL